MNKCVYTGRLTKDPEQKGTQENLVAKFSIAVDRKFKRPNQPEVDFFNCTAFGSTAKFVLNNFSKGKRIAVSGRTEINPYTDKNGVAKISVDVTVEDADFDDSKNGSGATPAAQAPADSTPQAAQGYVMNEPTGVEDELPFA